MGGFHQLFGSRTQPAASSRARMARTCCGVSLGIALPSGVVPTSCSGPTNPGSSLLNIVEGIRSSRASVMLVHLVQVPAYCYHFTLPLSLFGVPRSLQYRGGEPTLD